MVLNLAVTVLNLVRSTKFSTIQFSMYKAPEKQRPDGAAGAFGTGDTAGRYSTGTVVALSLSVQDRIPTAVRPALFPYPIH